MSKGNIFRQIEVPKFPTSTFDMSHDHKLTFDMGELVPVMLIETLPGDFFEYTPEILLRFAPLVSPVMHDIDVSLHCFFVPNRLLWSGWEDFITGEVSGQWPYFNLSGTDPAVGTLGDYYGLVDAGQSFNINAMPFAGYLLIYDEYYRDQNLISEQWQTLANGNNSWIDTYVTSAPLKRAWNHDYFTSCLDAPNAGAEVTLPLIQGGSVDVVSKGAGNVTGNLFRGVSDFVVSTSDSVSSGGSGTIEVGAQGSHTIDPNGDWEVDIDSEASTITTLRQAFRLQEFLERDKRGGTRYIENIYNHFGVIIEDYRINRPEYIGGVAGKMVISEVLSTAQTEVSAVEYPVGYMGGHGISVTGGNKIKYKCKEHGYIHAILSVRPRTSYMEQLHKHWRREERLDFAFPEFAQIGEQIVYNWEVYPIQSDPVKFEDEFGYIPRYSEYRFKNSEVSGLMRSTLEYWHLARDFSSEPGLNQAFIECSPDKRIFVDTASDGVYGHIINNLYVNRRLPKFGNPKL